MCHGNVIIKLIRNTLSANKKLYIHTLLPNKETNIQNRDT